MHTQHKTAVLYLLRAGADNHTREQTRNACRSHVSEAHHAVHGGHPEWLEGAPLRAICGYQMSAAV